jgi:predicted ATPase/DNA-binding SARP family transcriptional activator/Tfp pilus assembly protein PilF
VCSGRFVDDGRVEFHLLGPLEVVVDGRAVPLDAPKPRALLAILLLRANGPVSRELLIDELWAGRPPSSATKVLQTYVSQLRRALGFSVIRTVSSAYELRTEAGSLDVHRFEQLLQSARTATAAEANGMLREALSLWRGPPLAEFAYESWAQRETERLEELRLEALQERIESDLALGASAELVGELELLVARYPLRERLRAQLMLALYRSGRQADALAAYRAARRALVDALGIEPTPELRQLERRILDQDPALDLVAVEPPAASVALPGPSLQSGSSSFVGRTRELREIRELLRREEVRLLTLTGAAGSGKTRLALEVTSALEDAPAATVLVELGRITDARLVARTIAAELGVEERPGRTPREALLEYLQGRQALLLLDNFEHVLSAAGLVRELLAAAPGVKVLVTSRAPLDVPEERVHRVPALELPDPSQRTSIARLRRTEAIRLFLDRARAARPDFELSETNAGSVVELCIRLDGLPLAIELAAARSNLLSPGALLERLDSRLDLLKATPGSGVTERQWTLRAAIEWSYELLEPAEQLLFTSLAVFVGGFTLSGAELVAEQPDLDTVEGVETLLRNNLLTTERTRADEPRLGMLETLREYALERLAAHGHGDDVRSRHAGFYLELAEEAEPGLLGPQQREWLERLDAELDNIRAALTWAVDTREAEVGLRIGSALWRFWQLRDHLREGRERLEELLALGSGSPGTRAEAQTRTASLALQDDPETGRQLLEESLAVHRREGNARMVAHALGLLGMEAVAAGEIDSALALTRQALEVARGGVNPYVESAAFWQVGVCLAARGELDEAERTLEQAVDLARKLGNARSVAGSQTSVGGVALMRGDHARARRLFDESLNIYRGLDDVWGVSNSLSNLALLALEAGETESSRELLSKALAIERESGHHVWLANALELSARLAAADGAPALAIRLYARAALVREATTRWLHYELGWPDATPDLEDLRSRVGEATFEREWERGRAMTLLEAIDQASGKNCVSPPGHAPPMN